jgi:hypothetical protein
MLSFDHLKRYTITKFKTYFVYEISSFEGPITRDLMELDLNLFSKDTITYFLSGPPKIWSLTQHTFKRNDSDREVVGQVGVVLAIHDLRRHVAWGS